MAISEYIITTRPRIKFEPVETLCINVKNVPLTAIIKEGKNENIVKDIRKNKPSVVVLTSSIGAGEFFKHYYEYTENPDIIAIGEQTAGEVKRYTGRVSVPTAKNSYGVISLLEKYNNSRIALFRSNESNNIINDWLESHNSNFKEYYIYKVVKLENTHIKELFFNPECRGILLTSSMEARIFYREIGGSPVNKCIYAIGTVTAETLKNYGYKSCFTGNSNFESMVKYIDNKNCK